MFSSSWLTASAHDAIFYLDGLPNGWSDYYHSYHYEDREAYWQGCNVRFGSEDTTRVTKNSDSSLRFESFRASTYNIEWQPGSWGQILGSMYWIIDSTDSGNSQPYNNLMDSPFDEGTSKVFSTYHTAGSAPQLAPITTWTFTVKGLESYCESTNGDVFNTY